MKVYVLPLIEFLVVVFPLNRVSCFAFASPPPPSPWSWSSTFDMIIGILDNITEGITSSFNSFPLLQIYLLHRSQTIQGFERDVISLN